MGVLVADRLSSTSFIDGQPSLVVSLWRYQMTNSNLTSDPRIMGHSPSVQQSIRNAALQALAEGKMQFYRGVAYENGRGVLEDHQKAYEQYKCAYDLGYAPAAFNISQMHARHFVIGSTEEARWCRLAAEKGYGPAQINLGYMFEKGTRSVNYQEDIQKAKDLYLRAAKQGHSVALYNLGVLCLKGKGVLQSDWAAYVFFFLAVEGGLDHAIRAKYDTAEKLSPQELELAKLVAKHIMDHYEPPKFDVYEPYNPSQSHQVISS